MGWQVGWCTTWRRDRGYGVPAYCDRDDCDTEIHRGLAYMCEGCELYFCGPHGGGMGIKACERCENGLESFDPSPDHPDWVLHKATDPSWAEWRAEQNAAVA